MPPFCNVGRYRAHLAAASATVFALMPLPIQAADFTARQVTEALVRAQHGSQGAANFSGKDLSFLDLAGLDFKKARLAGVNLYGADLSKSSLAGADLAGARLDRANIAQADFANADLKGATLLSVTASQTVEPNPVDAPRFENADLTGAHIAARLDGANFRNAILSEARLGQLVATWGSYRPRAILNSADFSGAKLIHADLSKAVLQFTRFRGADLTRANLANCDLTQADLTGADLTGADISGADFDRAILTGVTGLESAEGLAAAKNLDKAVR